MKLSFLNLHNYKYRHIPLKSSSWFSLEGLDGYNILNLKLNSQFKKLTLPISYLCFNLVDGS
jgi:hypothetical protein